MPWQIKCHVYKCISFRAASYEVCYDAQTIQTAKYPFLQHKSLALTMKASALLWVSRLYFRNKKSRCDLFSEVSPSLKQQSQSQNWLLDNCAMKKYRICNNTLITISENYPATLRIATICFVHFPNDQILMKTRERKVETIKSNKKMKTKEQSKKWKVITC